MAFRCRQIIRVLRNTTILRCNAFSAVIKPEEVKPKPKYFRTENNLIYLEDPDTFGTLSQKIFHKENLENEGDKKEEEFIQNKPLPSQKLTIKQYADIIKQYLKYKRLREAIDVLEVRMLKEDRVKPENYIYNILIGACADVGYTKKAFKLFNDMKRRALKPTGDTYTCLFESCSNSPWALDGLKNATHLRELMIEKGVEPNLTNYNAMVKAFGRCGDLPMAFKIVDEMVSKKIKIRVHTLNHLLQACISDKTNGLRHALIIWRKMLSMKEKPNIYTFNLMLKCVKDCNLGSKEDIESLIFYIQEQIAIDTNNKKKKLITQSESNLQSNIEKDDKVRLLLEKSEELKAEKDTENNCISSLHITLGKDTTTNKRENKLIITEKEDNIRLEFIDKLPKVREHRVPNLLSRVVNMQMVTSLQEVHTLQDKFAVIGGQEDFLRIMEEYSVKPDIKTFTQMLPLLDESTEAENMLLDKMKSLEINADIDFYNMLIKKRCMRLDYECANDVMKIIKAESEFRKKRYPHSKKLRLNVNIMTYGVLALTCKTKENAEQLLNNMKEHQLKVNIEILGTLIKHGTFTSNFSYVSYIMDVVQEEGLQVNEMFLRHLENFNEKCLKIIEKGCNNGQSNPQRFQQAYKSFSNKYTNWLKELNVKETLKEEHPWDQFREPYPETVQRQNIKIKEPKRFFKRKHKLRRYIPQIV